MAKARIEILGDSSSYQRSVKEAAVVTDKLALDMKKLSVSAESSADLQVRASVRKTARLRNEILVYRQIAAASVKGSQEQIAATNLAARAERNLAGSLGISARESRALSVSASHAERDLGRATRGALAGSGVFRGLGRSIAFASGGFLAFASAGQFIRTSIDAAKEAQVTQKQLGAQFRASGLDLKTYQGAIDQTANRLALLAGFENDQVKAGFTTIFRTTNNVSKALRDTATAADLARAKHLSFAQASLIIAKTEAGNTTLLRRQGFQIAKNATSEQALAKLRGIIAGQAKAGTTAQERFGAVLHNTEEIIGTGILPTLNKYLEKGSEWLTQMNESGKLQKDVSRITHDVSRVFEDAAKAAGVFAEAFRGLNKITGSTEESLKSLGLAFVLLKARAKLLGLEGIGLGIAGIGAQSSVAAGEVSVLSASLAKLKGLGPIGVAVLLSFIPKGKTSTDPKAPSNNPVAKFFGNLPIVGGAFSQANALADRIDKRLGLIGQTQNPALPGRILPFPGGSVAARLRPQTTSTAAAGPRPLSLQGRFNLADLRLQNALITKSTADDRVQLVIEAAITKQQLAQTTTLKDRTAKTQQLVGIMSQIQGIDQANADAAKAAAQAAKDAAKQRRANLQLALQTREFKVLGLDATGNPFTPGLKPLRTELGNIGKLIKGTTLDTKKNKGLLGDVTKLLFGKDAHSLTKDVRSTVKSMLDALKDELKSSGGPETLFKKADLSKLTSGFGLSNADRKALEGRLSVVGAGGTVPKQTAANGGFGGQTVVVHHTTKLDGRVIEQNTTTHQQKRARRNPPQKRGPHAGGGV